MKKLILILPAVTLSGCLESMEVRYSNSGTGCNYSEFFIPANPFGNKERLDVHYEGVNCETIINKELKDSIHKKPWNSVPAQVLIDPPLNK
jgi:hypothetical protein